MKHAGNLALDRLEPLLAKLRRSPALKEKSRDVFYRGGRAFLHFHEDGEELFADMQAGDEFDRVPVTKAGERTVLSRKVRAALSAS